MQRSATRLARLNHGHIRHSWRLSSSKAPYSVVSGSSRMQYLRNLKVESHRQSGGDGPVTTVDSRNRGRDMASGKKWMITEGRDADLS